MMTSNERLPPAVCTDMALCNALGYNTSEVLTRLYCGESGLAPFDTGLGFSTHVGQVSANLPPLPDGLAQYDSRLARLSWYLAAQVQSSLKRAILRWGADRVAVVLATSTGGLLETEAAYAEVLRTQKLPQNYKLGHTHSLSATAELIARGCEIRGPSYVISTACSSSAKVLASAQRLIGAGIADAVLAGGLDTLCDLTLAGFRSLGILSDLPCRPFGRDRNGINIGEGGAFILLEREGEAGAAALLGSGETSDAYHMSAPDPQGLGAERAMHAALDQAGIRPTDVGYINTHGTGTKLNDEAEARAISRIFGSGVPVASTKGYTGHMLGAAGATEAALCIAALQRNEVAASLGSFPEQEDLGIRLCETPASLASPFVMSNSFAFGGNNISLVFGRYGG